MTDLAPYLDIAAFGSRIITITGDRTGAYVAAGYAAWVQSLTGSLPEIVSEGNTVRIVLTKEQVIAMQAWLDKVSSGPPGKIRYELSPVFTPWIARKAAPYGIGLFVAGAAVMYLIGKAL